MRVRSACQFILSPLVIISGTIGIVAQPQNTSIPPTTISLQKPDSTLGDIAQTLSKSSAIPIALSSGAAQQKCPATFANTPFWEALERTAQFSGMKIVVHEKGTKISLEPKGANREVSTTSGPFRVVVKQVIGRALLDLGVTFHEIYLDVHWEPRIPVFRIDTQPRIIKIIDDRGVVLSAPTNTASGYPTEAISDMKIKVNGLTRECKQIAVLSGEFRVTAAEKLLAFRFDDLTQKLPAIKTQNGVNVNLKAITKRDKFWEVDLELIYPESHPLFESFEEQKWLRDNKLLLFSPNGKPIEPENEEITSGGKRGRMLVTYRFPATLNPLAKGWVLTYETPSPLMELKIPFEIKNIPIP